MIRQGPDFLVDKDGKKESVAAAETEPRAGSADLKRIATFKRIQTWIFDLDNTLYPHHLNLWQQVDVRIRNYIVDFLKVTHEEAFRVQKDYYRRYGTTLRGLMEEHDLDPDSFLEMVHQIDHSPLTPNPALGAAIAALSGRKFILTNGTRGHADNESGDTGGSEDAGTDLAGVGERHKHGGGRDHAFRSASTAHDNVNAGADNRRGNAGGKIAICDQADARAGATNVIDKFFMARAVQHHHHKICNVTAQAACNGFQVFFYRRVQIDRVFA